MPYLTHLLVTALLIYTLIKNPPKTKIILYITHLIITAIVTYNLLVRTISIVF